MTELLKRAITGFLYVFVLLTCVYLGNPYYNALFFILGVLAILEFQKILQLKKAPVLIGFGISSILSYYNSVYFLTLSHILLLITLVVNTYLIYYLFSSKACMRTTIFKNSVAFFYVGCGILFLIGIPSIGVNFSSYTMLGILCIIWSNDSFAYLIGKSIGKTKLMPSVSPKKTIEGLAGGLFFSIITSVILFYFDKNNTFTCYQWISIALILVVFGNIGDLIESRFKRTANIKDSGNILPGHGGILDRLDSLIFAAPFIYLTIQIFTHVS